MQVLNYKLLKMLLNYINYYEIKYVLRIKLIMIFLLINLWF